MKCHITCINSFNKSDGLLIRQKKLLNMAEQLGFYEMGIFVYPVESDKKSDLDKRIDGIISPVEAGDIVLVQLPTNNGLLYEEELINKLLSYRAKVFTYIHGDYLDLYEKLDYLRILKNLQVNIVDNRRNWFCLKNNNFGEALLNHSLDLSAPKVLMDVLEKYYWINYKTVSVREIVDDEIHIGFGLHDQYGDYTPWLGVTMQSILEHTKSPICFHVLHDSTLKLENKNKLIHLVEKSQSQILFYNVNECIFKAVEKQMKGYTIGAMFRVLLPELLLNLGKIIYLDADLLVNDDVQKLWNIDITNYCLGAVADENVKNGNIVVNPVKQNVIQRDKYFNSGVICMNLKNIRNKGNMKDLVMGYLEKNSKSDLPDQDSLNVIYKNDTLLIDAKWNRFARNNRLNTNNLEPGIYHYVGTLCTPYLLDEMDLLYIQTLVDTPWKNKLHDIIGKSINRCNYQLDQFEKILPIITNPNIKRIFYGPENQNMRRIYNLINIREQDYRISNDCDTYSTLKPYPFERIKKETGFIIFVLIEADEGKGLDKLKKLGLVNMKDYFIIQNILTYPNGGYIV